MKPLIAAVALMFSASPAFSYDQLEICKYRNASQEANRLCQLAVSLTLRDYFDEKQQEFTQEEKRRQEIRTENERRAAMPHNDPDSVPLCQAPHRMTTRDGCQ